MRLVDAELIVEEFWKPEYRTQTRRDFIAVIDKSPAIDAIPIVRCQECKYKDECIRRIEFIGRNPVLEQNTNEYHPLEFCSYGQRKEDKYEVN